MASGLEHLQRALWRRGLPCFSLDWLTQAHERYPDVEELVTFALETVDFEDRRVVERGSLPAEAQPALLSKEDGVVVPIRGELLVFQVLDVADVSAAEEKADLPSGPERTLKLLLTDGRLELAAIEDAPIPDLGTSLPRCTKVCVRKPMLLHGLLVLRPENTSVVRPRPSCI